MSEETNPPVDTPLTIFLVEDDDTARPLLTKNFRKRGYRVLVAANFEDALEWVSGAPIHADLVLIDLVGKSPEEALKAGRELRERSKYDGHTPLVVMPERFAEELVGTDEQVSGNDWICHYEDAEQLHRLIGRLTNKDLARSG